MMTLEEEGAYIRLLCYCWNHGSIPSDPVQIARLVGKSCSNETATTVQRMFNERSTTVEGSFNDNTTLVHDRLEREKDKQAARRDQASEAGKKSAESRKKPTDVQRESNDRSFFVQRESNPISISSSSPTEEDIILEDDSGFPRDEPKRGRTTKFKPTDMAELIAYSLSEGGNESEAQDFFDKMEAKGWIVGKAKVKDWKAQFRTYHRNGWLNASSRNYSPSKSNYVQQDAREFTPEDTIRAMGGDDEAIERVRRLRAKYLQPS